MGKDQPLFRTVMGGGTFAVFPDEIQYDPLFGKARDKHWSIPRSALRDIACEKKLIGYMLRFQTDTAAYEVLTVLDADVIQVLSLVLPEKLQTDPVVRAIQQRRDDKAFREQQRAYEKQLAAYQQSLQPEQLVRTYKHNPEKDFRKDAARLAREGWVVQSQTAGGQKMAKFGEIVVLGNARERRVGEMTVVYTRPPRRPLPMPTQPQRPAGATPPSTPAPTPAAQQTPPSDPVPSAQSDLITQLEKLGELHQRGILTDEEFAEKKADILARM